MDIGAKQPGDLLDVRCVPGIPDDVLYVISEVDQDEILPGETVAQAYVRLGRAVRMELDEDD